MMKVKAAPGLKCPMEKQPHMYITDTVVSEVPVTPYYIRLINDGSLERVTEAKKK